MDVLAQASGIDPASATAWATGSAAGLLGLVLFWLAYYHLPAKDQQVTEIVNIYNSRTDAKDANIMRLVDTTIATANQQREAFAISLEKVVNHCQEENAKSRDSWARSIEPKIREVVSDETAKAMERIARRKPLEHHE